MFVARHPAFCSFVIIVSQIASTAKLAWNLVSSLRKAEEGRKDEKEKQVSADALVDDLLKVVKKSEQPFSMDDVVEDLKKQKKHSKEKKHKKKKSKKSRDKDRSRSASSERRSRKREKEKNSPSRRRRKSGSSSPSEEALKKHKTPTFDKISSDDDLPLGADFHSLQSTKADKENGSKASKSADSVAEKEFMLPVRSDKDKKKEHSPSPPLVKSEILKLDVNEKKKGEMVPRIIKKIAIGKLSLPVAKEETKKIDQPVVEEKEPMPSTSTMKDEPMPSTSAIPLPTSLSAPNLPIETNGSEIKLPAEPTESTVSELVTDDISDGSIPEDVKTGTAIKKRESKHSSRRRSVSSSSDGSDTEKKNKAGKGRGKRLPGMHSERDKDNGKSPRKRPATSSKNEKSRRSRSRSTSRKRARRSTSKSKRKRSKSRSRSPRRRRSSSPRSNRNSRRKNERDRNKDDGDAREEKIDKGKLLAIAKKKSRLLQQMGIMTSAGEPTMAATISGKSIDELVEYCQRVSKREEKEAQRKLGEEVSSDSEFEDFMAGTVKHPYAVNTTQTLGGITINIANAVPLPIRTVQERMLDESTLRLCYPVSSGTIHKEKTDTEWVPVDKNDVPVTVTNAVKQHKAVTSLQIEEAKKQGVQITPSPLIPPPPVPPSFDNLLSGPGAPPTFIEPLLPPPPLPPMFVPASEDKIIIKDPKKSKRDAPADVAKVLALRASAMQKLETDPNDYESRQAIQECDEDMQAWASQSHGSVPGKFTGSTGLRTLTADELQPHDPRFHAWVKKSQPKVTTWDSSSSSESD
ncbi:unnamed protein product, partial [Mesorhabditis belari]|uniref:G-patch domain-containing protein n=1 Tax=Mesorhabditis belari TaxID=2138241 RepID=A0AAF3EFH8_9BILA